MVSILIIADDGEVSARIRKDLSTLGFKSNVPKSFPEAKKLLAENKRISLIIAEGDGITTAKSLTLVNPSLKTVVVAEDIANHIRLPYPYNQEEFSKTIKSMV
jgi:DNA-binding NtrC family response regulator